MNSTYDYLFKYIVLGGTIDDRVSFIRSYTGNTEFDTARETPTSSRCSACGHISQPSTITTQKVSVTKELEFAEKRCKLVLWIYDKSLVRANCGWYRTAHGFIVLYDVSSPVSFENVQLWLKEIHRYTTTNNIVLIGINAEVISSDEEISTVGEVTCPHLRTIELNEESTTRAIELLMEHNMHLYKKQREEQRIEKETARRRSLSKFWT